MLSHSFSQETLNRCSIMITDGDSQETNQLDTAIQDFFPHVYRSRCGYHLNKNNWEKNGPKIAKTDEKYNSCSLQTNVISDWIYSLMKPTCETELQYLG